MCKWDNWCKNGLQKMDRRERIAENRPQKLDGREWTIQECIAGNGLFKNGPPRTDCRKWTVQQRTAKRMNGQQNIDSKENKIRPWTSDRTRIEDSNMSSSMRSSMSSYRMRGTTSFQPRDLTQGDNNEVCGCKCMKGHIRHEDK